MANLWKEELEGIAMQNMIDYLAWRGDLSFERDVLNPVDMLIFAQLVHAPLENLKGGGIGGTLTQMRALVYPSPPDKDAPALVLSRYKLWRAAERTQRYGSVTLLRFTSHFEPEAEKQFAAAVFSAGNAAIVSFRGTDSTLVGWKEDFNLSFESPIPSQREAVQFLKEAVGIGKTLYVGGHSKGGNLALYSAAMCAPEARQRIKQVYSFDSPGLDESVCESAGYAEISGRVSAYVPESSVIGMLLGHHDHYSIIRSDSVSLWQHNPYYWHVLGSDFVPASETTRTSRVTDSALHEFLRKATPHERRVMINTIFRVLSASTAQTVSELPRRITQHWPEVLAALKDVPPKNYYVLLKMLKLLASAGSESWQSLMRNAFTEPPKLS